MKITVNINGTDYEGNVEPVTFCENKTENTKTGFERIKRENAYYSILKREPIGFIEDFDDTDCERFAKGNYFSSFDLAEDYHRAIFLFLKLSRWQAEHDEQPDLKSGFYITYDYVVKDFTITCHTEYRGIFEITFSTEEAAETLVFGRYSIRT